MLTTIRGASVAALILALLSALAFAAPAAAGSPQRVTIVSHVTFNPDGPNFGDFEASGPAVADGVICAEGTFVDTGIKFAGFQARTGRVQLKVDKAFTCADGGSFEVTLRIHADFTTGLESFTWGADGVPGPYATLHGSGQGSTVPTATGNINTYEGFVLH